MKASSEQACLGAALLELGLMPCTKSQVHLDSILIPRCAALDPTPLLMNLYCKADDRHRLLFIAIRIFRKRNNVPTNVLSYPP